ncbi:MAG TPA: SBBP repeat-containing protein, partial [Candidatus Sulfotelmatobacter sp.]|nr:SBBP repeat-containing protein [Candidatus Sulfotelmatobacter sp.]
TGGGIAVDSSGNMYFSGTTNFFNSGNGSYGNSNASTDFPVLNAYQPCLDTPPPTTVPNAVNSCIAPATPYPTDAFVAKLNPNAQAGAQLLFSTYLGGTAKDTSTGIAVDSGAANVYITGSTYSAPFSLPPTSSVPFESCLNNGNPAGSTAACASANTTSSDAYVARLSNPNLSTTGTPNDVVLNYFSYLGGSGDDAGLAIAVDTAGDALVTGTTTSTNFPVTTPGALQSALAVGATQNAFLARINTTPITNTNNVGSYVTYFGGNVSDRGTSIAVDPVTLNTYFAGDTTSANFPTQNALLQTTLNGPSDAFVAELVPAPNVCITCTAPTYSSTGILSAGNPVTITFTVTNQGPDLATGVFVSGSVSSGVTFTSATAGSGSCSTPVSNNVVCTIPTLQAGATSSVLFNVTPTGACTACSATAQVIKVNNANANIAAQPAPFQAGSFTLNVGPSSQTVRAGAVAKYAVQISPQPTFVSPVSLTCSGAPTGASCNFTSSSVTPSNSPQSVALNLTTTPQPVTTVASAAGRSPLYALWLLVPGMSLLGIGVGSKRVRRRWMGLLILSLFFALVLLQPACSSGAKTPAQVSGTPTGTYSLTVTATSGSFTKSAGFQLTVTP